MSDVPLIRTANRLPCVASRALCRRISSSTSNQNASGSMAYRAVRASLAISAMPSLPAACRHTARQPAELCEQTLGQLIAPNRAGRAAFCSHAERPSLCGSMYRITCSHLSVMSALCASFALPFCGVSRYGALPPPTSAEMLWYRARASFTRACRILCFMSVCLSGCVCRCRLPTSSTQPTPSGPTVWQSPTGSPCASGEVAPTTDLVERYTARAVPALCVCGASELVLCVRQSADHRRGRTALCLQIGDGAPDDVGRHRGAAVCGEFRHVCVCFLCVVCVWCRIGATVAAPILCVCCSVWLRP